MWIDQAGAHEKVFDVVWSGDRRRDPRTPFARGVAGMGQLLVALGERRLEAGGGVAVNPVGGIERGAAGGHLVFRQHAGDLQQHRVLNR